MEKPESPTALANAIGISIPYASQLLSDNEKQRRTPSRALAIRIFRETGWRHASIATLSDDQLATLEAIDPWTPRPSEQSSAAAL